MSDEKALLAAIRDNPDEDTPRLMYADWLDEHGQADRAEFIRVQIDAANLSGADPLITAKARRARQLLGQHAEEWTEPFAWVLDGLRPVAWNDDPSSPGSITDVGITGMPPGEAFPASPFAPSMNFDRGFISVVAPSMKAFLSQAPDTPLRPSPPPEVSLMWLADDARGEPNRLFPELCERLTPERFSGWRFIGAGGLGDRWVEALADEPSLATGLVGLSPPYQTTAHSLRRLLSVTPRLVDLTLDNINEHSRELLPIIRAIVEAGTNTRLTLLVMMNLWSDSVEMPAVFTELATAEWPLLRRITFHSWSGESSLKDEWTGRPFPRLEFLTLHGVRITEAQLTTVLECPAFRTACVQYGEQDAKRPDLRELEERYRPRFRCLE